MIKTDTVCLNIYKILFEAHKNNSDKYGVHSNIIGVFFHELFFYLTNYVIIKNSKYSYKQPLDNFPFLNSEYVNRPYKVDLFPNRIKRKYYFRTIIKYCLVNMISTIIKIIYPKRPSFYLSTIYNGRIKGNQIIKTLIKNRIPIFIFFNKKVYLPNIKDQLELLKQTLKKISNLYKINNSDIFANNFIEYVKKNIYWKKINKNKKILINGTNATFFNRANAANFKSTGGSVIQIAHGENSSFVIDDPIMGYSEHSYCDYVIDYGGKAKEYGKYNQPLFGHDPKIINGTSDFLKNIYSDSKINNQKSSKSKILYIPTAFSGNITYGPFRSYDDLDYLLWQRELMGSLPNITIKPHPKDVIKYNYYNSYSIEKSPLIDLIDLYDIFIFDQISTAFAIIAASSKPIIYFDIGQRNISEHAMKDIEKRVYKKQIDIFNINNNQIKDTLDDFNFSYKGQINSFTANYSINNFFNNEMDALLTAVKSF